MRLPTVIVALLFAMCVAFVACADPGGPDYATRGSVVLTSSAAQVTGGSNVTLTISLGDVVGSNTTVALSASPASAFTNLPSSVVIPAGHTYVIVTVTTATVSTTVNATVTASATNYTTGTCGVTITP